MAHVLILPHPAQGHINPALAFATHLSSINGLKLTFIITTNLHNKAKFPSSTSLTIHHISDGSEHVTEPETIEAYFTRFEAVLSASLADYIDELMRSSSSPPKLVVYDSTMPWVLEVAKERGLLGAPFFTQSAAVSAVFYHLKLGFLKFPYEGDGEAVLPALPPLGLMDLPSLTEFMDENRTVVKLLGDQFLNLERVDWIFINTFHLLEQEVLDWMTNKWPSIKTVGPTFLLQEKFDKSSDNTNHTINMFEPKQDTYKEWLESRETASVVYVSFGSIASLGREQMEELAHGLALSNSHFLWVVRPSEVEKLPPNFDPEKGLIVEWCHQPRVLAHASNPRVLPDSLWVELDSRSPGPWRASSRHAPVGRPKHER